MKIRALILSSLLVAHASGQVEEVRQAPRLPKFLERLDTNEDGEIDEDEAQAIRELRIQLHKERRTQIDFDDDGIISQDEIATARQMVRDLIYERRVAYFKNLSGIDEFVTLEEFSNHPSFWSFPEETILALFARLDANQDGAVSIEEFFARLRAHEAPAPSEDLEQ